MTDRELDALVAKHVFGWRWVERGGFEWIVPPDVVPDIAFFMWGHRIHDDKPQFSGEFENVLPHYSTDIAAAWKVVEAMRAAGYRVATESREGEGWLCEIGRTVDGEFWVKGASEGESAPRAICLAALRAKGVNVD